MKQGLFLMPRSFAINQKGCLSMTLGRFAVLTQSCENPTKGSHVRFLFGCLCVCETTRPIGSIDMLSPLDSRCF